MVNHDRNPRRCCCCIYQAALTAVVPDEHLYSDFLGGESLERRLAVVELFQADRRMMRSVPTRTGSVRWALLPGPQVPPVLYSCSGCRHA